MAHAKFGASSAKRWVTCPASIQAGGKESSRHKEAADLGSAVHALGESLLQSARILSTKKGQKTSDLGLFSKILTEMLQDPEVYFSGEVFQTEIEGDSFFVHSANKQELLSVFGTDSAGLIKKTCDRVWEIDEGMADGAICYIESVVSILKPHVSKFGHIDIEVWLETPFDDMGGTADLIIHIPFDTLFVIDYKNGRFLVEVEDNFQAKFYGVFALDKYQDVEIVETVIIQPNTPHIEGPCRFSLYSVEELEDYKKKLFEAREVALSKNPPFTPSDECFFCPANPCRAGEAKTQEIAKAEFMFLPEEIDNKNLTDEELVNILKWKPFVDNFFKSVLAKATEQLEKGNKIPHLKLVQKYGNRAFVNEKESEKVFIKLFEKEGLDTKKLYSPAKLKSPAQLEKLKIKELNGLLCQKQHVDKKDNGKVLTIEEDPRPEVKFESEFPALD